MHSPPLGFVKLVWDAVVRLFQPIGDWRDRMRERKILLVTSPSRTWTLQGIADAARMDENDALKALRRLREKGLASALSSC